MTRRWEALGLRCSLRSQARVDRRRAHRRERVVGMVRTAAGLCPRGGGQATSSDPLHRPRSSRVQHRCPGGARGSTVPAGRVFSLKATRLVSSKPAATGGGLGSNNTAESIQDAPTTWPGSCGSSGAPRPGWSPARYSIYTYHTM
jgi:hypothetical protein